MPLETAPYDSAEHLRTLEDVALYIEAALEDGDPALVRHALGVVARAQGTARGAREALSAEGDPSFGTVLSVLRALGVRLTATPL